jgi:hypothetical protein
LFLFDNVTDVNTVKAKMFEINAKRAEFESSVPTLPGKIFQKARAQADESAVLELFHSL